MQSPSRVSGDIVLKFSVQMPPEEASCLRGFFFKKSCLMGVVGYVCPSLLPDLRTLQFQGKKTARLSTAGLRGQMELKPSQVMRRRRP